MQLVLPSPEFAVAVGAVVFAIGGLKRHFLLFSLAALPSTLAHELAHFLFSFVTGGQPAGINLIPRRDGNRYTLGSVTIRNARWWNCTLIGFAPVSLLPIAYWVSISKYGSLSFSGTSAAAVYITASLIHGCVPSTQDVRVAFGSPGVWVVLGLAALYSVSVYIR